jgi:hypothetical protein
MNKVTLIQVIPMPANRKLVDKEGNESICDIVAYFHSDDDNCIHEIPLAFGEVNMFDPVDELESWTEWFVHFENDYRIVDR